MFAPALTHRHDLLSALHAEGTDAYRLFHGVAEGWPGLTVDRYGPQILVQTFREPLTAEQHEAIERWSLEAVPEATHVVFNHRGDGVPVASQAPPEATLPLVCHELGASFRILGRHRGQDPLLFLDLREARRYVRHNSAGKSVLNLFAYTCGVGIQAALGGAREVWNVDFARFALDVGRENLALNDLDPDKTRFVREDVFAIIRQLSGAPVGRRGRRRRYQKVPRRTFDLVFLDPPAWAKGPFGAVDVVRDYQSMFKPALLATAEGGTLVCTNHVASVDLDAWLADLRRCAEKAGRTIERLDTLDPPDDFPSFDESPPLKVALVQVE